MKILIPVDDIFFGSAIVNFLLKHNWPQGSQFRVINIIEPVAIDKEAEIEYTPFLENAGKKVRDAAAKMVKEVAGYITDAFPEAAVSHCAIEGSIKEEIVGIAEAWKADLIVAGSHGRSGFNRWVLGSISLDLLSASPCPVVLVKPDAQTLEIWKKVDLQTLSMANIQKHFARPLTRKDPQRILVALDDTDLSDQLIDFVTLHEWARPANVKVLTVVQQPSWLTSVATPFAKEFFQDKIDKRNCNLRHYALRLRDFYHSSHIEEELVEGNPKQAIVEAAVTWRADMIVVGCHVHGSESKVSPGSVGLAVLCTAPCSTMLIRQNKQENNISAGAKTNEDFMAANASRT